MYWARPVPNGRRSREPRDTRALFHTHIHPASRSLLGAQEAGVIPSPTGQPWPPPQGAMPYPAIGHPGLLGSQRGKAREPDSQSQKTLDSEFTRHTCTCALTQAQGHGHLPHLRIHRHAHLSSFTAVHTETHEVPNHEAPRPSPWSLQAQCGRPVHAGGRGAVPAPLP